MKVVNQETGEDISDQFQEQENDRLKGPPRSGRRPSQRR
jgi:hypothetical protein